MPKRRIKPRSIHFVSLGCAKNRVDSEVMAGFAQERGLAIAADPTHADVIVVNTCGFIESAKEESIQVLLEMAKLTADGSRQLIAAGCMAKRYMADLVREMPEIDYLIGPSQLGALTAILDGGGERIAVGGPGHYLQTKKTPRFIEPGTFSTYLKIGDGCSRRCAFCAIPAIRGRARSRPVDDIVNEARALVARGVKELNLVAQDTGAYGRELGDGVDLPRLIGALDEIPGDFWIRLLYLYPDTVSDALLHAMSRAAHVVPYLDIPIQHASPRILKRMRRGHGQGALKALIRRIREVLPEAFLRTTVLVGHPGETEADVETLLAFVEWAQFDHLGVFRYSDEEGTAAFGAPDSVRARDSYNRYRSVMALQRRVGCAKNRARLGQTIAVLVEESADDMGYVRSGRHAGQAPEIDGVTYLISSEAKPGEIIEARVVKTGDYDIVAEDMRGPK